MPPSQNLVQTFAPETLADICMADAVELRELSPPIVLDQHRLRRIMWSHPDKPRRIAIIHMICWCNEGPASSNHPEANERCASIPWMSRVFVMPGTLGKLSQILVRDREHPDFRRPVEVPYETSLLVRIR